MDWGSIIGIVTAALVGVILPLVIRRRRSKKGSKEGLDEAQKLCQHLKAMGIKASLAEVDKTKGRASVKRRSWGEELVGVVELRGKSIDRINLVGVASQYETHYRLDWVVENPHLIGKGAEKKIKLHKGKSPPLWGKVVDVEWRGENPLVRGLNLDYHLKDRLLATSFKGDIEVVPEPKQGYVRMRTDYLMPSPDLFEALDIIAGHIQSGG
jgi:hypothetical protein